MPALISLELTYDISDIARPVLRYHNQRVSGAGEVEARQFALAAFQTAIGQIAEWLQVCRSVGRPAPPPETPAAVYRVEIKRLQTGSSTFELVIGNLTYEIEYADRVITVLTYSSFDVSWEEFVFALDAVRHFLVNIVGAP